MAKFLSSLLLLLLAVLQVHVVTSTGSADFGSMPVEEQQVFAETEDFTARTGESSICKYKRDLLLHLAQLSFYLKADCQQQNRSFVGCSCFPASCEPQCVPRRVCCPQNTTTLLHELQNFNLLYASNFKQLFGGAPSERFAQLDYE